jgi:hypothetical protein
VRVLNDVLSSADPLGRKIFYIFIFRTRHFYVCIMLYLNVLDAATVELKTSTEWSPNSLGINPFYYHVWN